MKNAVPPLRKYEPSPSRVSQSEQFFGTINGCITVIGYLILALVVSGGAMFFLALIASIRSTS